MSNYTNYSLPSCFSDLAPKWQAPSSYAHHAIARGHVCPPQQRNLQGLRRVLHLACCWDDPRIVDNSSTSKCMQQNESSKNAYYLSRLHIISCLMALICDYAVPSSAILKCCATLWPETSHSSVLAGPLVLLAERHCLSSAADERLAEGREALFPFRSCTNIYARSKWL